MQPFYRILRVLLLLGAALTLASCFDADGAENAALQRQFQEQLDALYAKYKFPGATASYVLPDGTVGVAAVGVSDLETKTPMPTDARMLAASIGKSFVGATAIALVQEGRLDLDAKISTWLGDKPWFSHLPNHDTITLSQLLTQSSGLPNHVYSPEFQQEFREKWNKPGDPFKPDDLVGFILDKPALFEAGKGWAYSDTNYILVGMIIEEVSDNTLYEEIIDRFLVPLRLGRTAPSNYRTLPGLVAGYMPEENDFGLPPVTTVAPGIMAWNPAIEWAGGGFASTSRDLAVWAKALYEGKAIAGGDYLDDLFRSVPLGDDSPGISYGAGVAIRENGPFGKSLGHGGGIPGYASSMRYYPEHRVSIAFQVNVDSGIAGGEPLVENFYEEMEQQLAGAVINAAKSQ